MRYVASELVPIEILAPGTYISTSGDPIPVETEQLDAMVANFSALAQFIKPPLKLGHGKQVIAQPAGQPALGWVARLTRAGRKLIAHVADMPDVVKAAIRTGRYRRVSAEFLLDFGATVWEQNLKTGVRGPVLEAVALLGADLPQCAELADLTAYLALPPEADMTGATHVTATLDAPAARTLLARGGLYDMNRKVCDAVAARFPGGEAFCEDVQLKALGADEDCAIVNVSGSLMRYPVTLGADGVVELGEPTAVQVDYVSASTPSRSSALSDPVSKETPMPDEKNDETLRAELDAQRAELAAVRAKQAEDAAERARLSAEVESLRVARDAALNKAREQEAVAFASRFSSGDTMRVLPAQAAWLSALYRHVATSGEAVVCAAADAERMELAASGAGRDMTALELLEGFLLAGPDRKILLSAIPRSADPTTGDDYDTVLATIARREKLNLSVATEKAQATRMLAKERPDLTGVRVAQREG